MLNLKDYNDIMKQIPYGGNGLLFHLACIFTPTYVGYQDLFYLTSVLHKKFNWIVNHLRHHTDPSKPLIYGKCISFLWHEVKSTNNFYYWPIIKWYLNKPWFFDLVEETLSILNYYNFHSLVDRRILNDVLEPSCALIDYEEFPIIRFQEMIITSGIFSGVFGRCYYHDCEVMDDVIEYYETETLLSLIDQGCLTSSSQMELLEAMFRQSTIPRQVVDSILTIHGPRILSINLKLLCKKIILKRLKVERIPEGMIPTTLLSFLKYDRLLVLKYVR